MYSASRVLLALKESSVKTKGHEYIKCPLDRCYRTPTSCHRAREQTCTQEVTVLYQHENHNKSVNLRFYFTISSTNHDGFIYDNNESLQLLIRREIIKEESIREPRVIPNEPELFENV